jgi:hypothetical protein
MSFNVTALLILGGLFGGILICLKLGQHIGQRNRAELTETARARLTAVEAAIFGLMGLMIAFTFSGAAQRYELRRQLTVDETNAISTSYLRLDLLPASRQVALREKYRRYLETRLAVYQVLPDITASTRQATVARELQQEIWTGTIAALAEAPPEAKIVVLQALNRMIDVTTSRAIAALTHSPRLTMAMLLMLGFVCSLLAGYTIAGIQPRQVNLHLLAFTLVVSITIYIIFDLDYPRFGLIRLDFADQGLLDLLAQMK